MCFFKIGADSTAPIQSDTAHFTQDKRMDLEQAAMCPEKFESAPERQTAIKAREGGPALVPGANFIRCTTMVRKHSILFAGQMCHP